MNSLRRLAAVSVALALGLAIAAPAGARKFQMSSTWIYRGGGNFIPIQFAASGSMMTHASMGDLSEALGYPNGPIPGKGVVTATGSSPATLQIPRHRFVEDAMTLYVFNKFAGSLIQISTNFGIDGPYATAALAAGLGPGSFTWCPTDPACVAGGGMLSTDPPRGAGARKGRVIYRAGANRFGGVMQLGLRRAGDAVVPFGSGSPRRAVHLPLGGNDTALRAQAPGGLGSADAPAKQMVHLAHAFVTQPTMWPAMGSPILYPGPKMTTMFGVTSTGAGPVFYFPQIATGPLGTPAGQFTTQYGFAQTTGTAIVQQSVGSSGSDFFTVMGSDARTPLGAGNISLVAGGLSFRHNNVSRQGAPYGTFQKLTLTLAPPTPSLSPAGGAAAGALVLLAAGYALRRRLG